MELGIPLAELAILAFVLALGGCLTGFLAGLLGIGGGGVLVPILYELFGVVGVADGIRMHLSVGTSLAIIIPTSIRSFRSHRAKGAVDMDVLRRLGPPVAAGVIAGIIIAYFADGTALKTVYVFSCILMAAKLFAGGERWVLGATLPGNPVNALAGLFIGVISTLIGIGGGVYVTSWMTLFRRPIHQSVATAAGFGPIIAIPAVLGYIYSGWGHPDLPAGSLGFASLLGAALVIPTSVWTAPFGVRVAHGLSRRALELAFATFLSLVAVRFAFSLLA